MTAATSINLLTPEIENRVKLNPLLNIDTFIIPSPYIKDPGNRKDYQRSYVWTEEGEVLGYLLTYASTDGREYLIYKLVTSPFGRGRGIGRAFLERLANDTPSESRIYLYVWEKQTDTVEWFRNRGFGVEESIVYRNMVYHRLGVSREVLLNGQESSTAAPAADEIGRTRHDARKIVRQLNAMVNALAPENAGRVIEDINRETTTLVNMLNTFRDSAALGHEVNLQDLILERLVPYVETSPVEVELILKLGATKPMVLGHWLNIGRALVNLASNALDAIAESGKPGIMRISIREDGDQIILRISDNGVGIAPQLLEPDAQGRPAFIGRSTKADGAGEGLGTVQVWTTFGADRVKVDSVLGEGTDWTLRFDRSAQGLTKRFASLQRRFHELQGLHKEIELSPDTPRTDVISAIWQLRKREVFLIDLILRFSRYHNIRDLYRTVLAYFQGRMAEAAFLDEVEHWKGEHHSLNGWLSATARRIRRRWVELENTVDLEDYQGALFKSYGQALDNIIIFTLNPATGTFLATDRKLAEHLDFVPYLGDRRDTMLRGEFVGDVNNDDRPIYFGVWSVESEDDLLKKLALIRHGAQVLLTFGIHPEKRLAFYQTTYVRHERDIDTDAVTTFGEFAGLSDDGLKDFIRQAEDEMHGFLVALE